MTAGMASDNKQTKHHHAPATEYYPFKTSVLTSFMQTDNTLPGGENGDRHGWPPNTKGGTCRPGDKSA